MHYFDTNRMDSQKNLAVTNIGYVQEIVGIPIQGSSECLPTCVFAASRGAPVVNNLPKRGTKFHPIPIPNNVGNWE